MRREANFYQRSEHRRATQRPLFDHLNLFLKAIYL